MWFYIEWKARLCNNVAATGWQNNFYLPEMNVGILWQNVLRLRRMYIFYSNIRVGYLDDNIFQWKRAIFWGPSARAVHFSIFLTLVSCVLSFTRCFDVCILENSLEWALQLPCCQFNRHIYRYTNLFFTALFFPRLHLHLFALKYIMVITAITKTAQQHLSSETSNSMLKLKIIDSISNIK